MIFVLQKTSWNPGLQNIFHGLYIYIYNIFICYYYIITLSWIYCTSFDTYPQSDLVTTNTLIIYIYIYIYILKWVDPRRHLYAFFSVLLIRFVLTYVYVSHTLFSSGHIWQKVLLMGYSMGHFSSLNGFQLVRYLYEGYPYLFLIRCLHKHVLPHPHWPLIYIYIYI